MNTATKLILLAGGLILAAIAGSSVRAEAGTLKQAAEATYPLYDGPYKICSATAVSPTQLITAYHCIDGSKDNTGRVAIGSDVLDAKQKVMSSTKNFVTFVRTDKTKDIALIELKDKSTSLPYINICEEDAAPLQMGDPVWVIGYPKGFEKTLTTGLFSSLVDMDGLTEGALEGVFYKATAPMTGGNSGGGFYRLDGNDHCLGGTSSAGWRDVSFMNYFSPVESIRFITKNLLVFEAKEATKTATPTKPLKNNGWSIDRM